MELHFQRSLPDTVRVLLAKQSGAIILEAANDLLLSASGEQKALVKPGNTINAVPDGNLISLSIGKNTFRDSVFSIIPTDVEPILTYKKRQFPGSFSILNRSGSLYLINTVGLNKYVEGVLCAELGKIQFEGAAAAIEAFTVCVRTYTVNKTRKIPSGFYDIESSTADQLYYGMNPYPQYSEAVRETENEILSISGKPAPVFYHTSCGGFTESFSNVYGTADYPHLTSVQDGDPANCGSYPGFAWVDTIQIATVLSNLRIQKYLPETAGTEIELIRIAGRFPSGRVNELHIVLSGGDTVKVQSNKIRSVLTRAGNRILRSTLFEFQSPDADSDPNQLIVRGRGNGHGVGMCQWGAMRLSRKGKTKEEILEHYFPGAVIGDENEE